MTRSANPRAFGLSDEDLRALGYAVGPREDEPERGGKEAPRVTPRRDRDPAVRTWLATVVVLAGLLWLGHPNRSLPEPVPAAAPDTAFSSARAMAQLVEVAGELRTVGSPGHERVRARLVNRLETLGLEPRVHTAISVARAESGELVSATVRNVVATLPGAGGEGVVVLMAPYDGGPDSPSAGRAFGVGVVLEVARSLTASVPGRADVVVAFTDADLVEPLGTSVLMHDLAEGRPVLGVVSVAAFGGTGSAVVLRAAGDGWDGVDAPTSRPGASSVGRGITSPMPWPASEATIEGAVLHVLAVGSLSTADQPFDSAERIDERTLQDVGSAALEAVRGRSRAGPATPSAARATAWIPFVGAVGYPEANRWMVVLGLCLAFALVGGGLRLRGCGWRDVAVGFAAGLGVVAATALSAEAIVEAIAIRHPEHGFVRGGFYRDGPHIAAIAAVAVAVAASGYAALRRWFRADALSVGALLVPLSGWLWLAVRVPEATLAAGLPLALALVGAGVLVAAGPDRWGRGWLCAAVLVPIGGAVLLSVAPVSVVSRAWGLTDPARIGAVMGVVVLVGLPVAEWLSRPRAWWTPLCASGVAASLLAVALPAVGPRAAHPVPTSLVYLADEPVRSPLATMVPGAEPVDPDGPRRMAGRWLTVAGPGERWARSWAAEPPPPGEEVGTLMLPRSERWIPAGSGPDSELVRPRVRVVADSAVGVDREVTVAVRSGLPGEMLGLRLTGGGRARISAVDSVRVPLRDVPAREVRHWGRWSGELLRVSVTVPVEATELRMDVVEHHLRPRELLGDFGFVMPDSLIPNVSTGSGRMILRTPVRLDLTTESTRSSESDADPAPR